MNVELPSRSRSIVVIDDDRGFADSLAELCGLVENLEVLGTAYNVADGIELLASTRPDLGLVDVHMPGGGGRAVALAVDDLDDTLHLVFISAQQHPGDRELWPFLAKQDITPARLASLIDWFDP